MTDINNNNQLMIYCPYRKASITVELGEYVNGNPESKKQAIEEEIQLWGEAYDRSLSNTECGFLSKLPQGKSF